MTSCRVWSFDLIIPWKQQYLILWSVVLLQQPCAILSLLSSYVTTHKRHPTKTTTKQIVCKLLFTSQPRVRFYFWEMFTFIFPNMVPPSLNLSCHLLSPPIRPPIHPIVNSCPSLKRTSTLTFTFSIQFSAVNSPCYECGPIEHNFPLLSFWSTKECHILCFFSLFWHSQYLKFQYCHQCSDTMLYTWKP